MVNFWLTKITHNFQLLKFFPFLFSTGLRLFCWVIFLSCSCSIIEKKGLSCDLSVLNLTLTLNKQCLNSYSADFPYPYNSRHIIKESTSLKQSLGLWIKWILQKSSTVSSLWTFLEFVYIFSVSFLLNFVIFCLSFFFLNFNRGYFLGSGLLFFKLYKIHFPQYFRSLLFKIISRIHWSALLN